MMGTAEGPARLSIIVPCRDHVLTVAHTVRRCLALPVRVEVVVADHGSTDGSRRVLRRLDDPRVKVVLCDGAGVGGAVKTAARCATAEFVAIQDAGLMHQPEELPRLLGHLEAGDAEIVCGSRFLGCHRSLTFGRMLANRALNLFANVLFNSCLTDLATGCRVLSTKLLNELELSSSGPEFGAEITARALRRGLRLLEVPVTCVASGQDGEAAGGWAEGLRLLGTLARERVRRGDPLDASLDTLSRLDVYTRWVASWVEPYVGARMMEVGAGKGSLARHFIDRELLCLCDYNQEYVQVLRSRFRHAPHVRCDRWDITDPGPAEEFRAMGLDTVLSSNVLEHIEDDLLAVRNMKSVLAPKGRLIVIVPAMQRIYGTLDQAFGHFRRYDRTTLGKLLEESGLEVEQIRYRNRLGAVGWWVQGRLFKSRYIPATSVLGFRLLWPLPRLIDRLWGGNVGQSLVAVGRVR
ncbi:MAG: glycosyltransferase [Candidatus Riflebacteria bacterium]|nr:glycosyltransferase [Candidatus Riflebacteria bacterium]